MVKNTKKRLSEQQEFEIMKLVLDKFLWLGFAVMAYGGLRMFQGGESLAVGFSWVVAGAIVLILFMVLIVREYEIIK